MNFSRAIHQLSFWFFLGRGGRGEGGLILFFRSIVLFALVTYYCLKFQAIAKDAILSRCKIIAEPWDCRGLYLVGKFPNWDR